MHVAILLAALSAVFVLCAAQRGAGIKACFIGCNFKLCNEEPFPGTIFTPVVPVGKSDVAKTPPICRRDDVNIGRISSTGEAYVPRPELGGVVGISELGLGFSPSFFKTYDIMDNGTIKSGIGNEVPNDTHRAFFRFVCVGLPIRSYQVLDDNGNVIGNEQGTDRFTDCIAFRALPGGR